MLHISYLMLMDEFLTVESMRTMRQFSMAIRFLYFVHVPASTWVINQPTKVTMVYFLQGVEGNWVTVKKKIGLKIHLSGVSQSQAVTTELWVTDSTIHYNYAEEYCIKVCRAPLLGKLL